MSLKLVPRGGGQRYAALWSLGSGVEVEVEVWKCGSVGVWECGSVEVDGVGRKKVSLVKRKVCRYGTCN